MVACVRAVARVRAVAGVSAVAHVIGLSYRVDDGMNLRVPKHEIFYSCF